jgi:hypothetical protein
MRQACVAEQAAECFVDVVAAQRLAELVCVHEPVAVLPGNAGGFTLGSLALLLTLKGFDRNCRQPEGAAAPLGLRFGRAPSR